MAYRSAINFKATRTEVNQASSGRQLLRPDRLDTENLFRRVQVIQNATARLITGVRRHEHITPVLKQLHWLQSGSVCTSNWLPWCLELCMAQHHILSGRGLSTRRLHRLPPTAIVERQHVPRRPNKYASRRSFIRRLCRWSETLEQPANLSSPA